MVICLHLIQSQVSTFYGVSVSVCVYVYTHICQSLLILFFVCLLKGTVGLPHVFDIDHGLCDAAWLGVDQTFRCYQLIISRPQAYFWVSENTTQKNFHLHILGASLIQKPPSRQVKCKALGCGEGYITQIFSHSWSMWLMVYGELPFQAGLWDMVLMGTAVALNLYFCHHINHM